MLTDAEILEVWEHALDKPIPFQRMPTVNDVILIRIKAVLKAERERIITYLDGANDTRELAHRLEMEFGIYLFPKKLKEKP